MGITAPSVLVSIVTYNSKHMFDVLDQLKSEFATHKQFKFVIFDNNSSIEYQEKLKTYIPFVSVNFHSENSGFGFGHNYNLLQAKEDYFLVLNPDVMLKKEDLLNMMKIMETSNQIGLTVPRVLNSDGTPQYLIRNRVSVFDYALRFTPIKFIKKLFNKRLSRYECRDLPLDKNIPVRIGSGCFMLLSSKAYKEIGGFDDRYFMYFEDYDLCLELEKRNYQIIYCPSATIIHFYEKEAHKNRKLFKIFMQSMYKFFNKWGWKLI
ncbi:glycosyltransferase family 2 protein [Carnobacterium maltaromaticum]|uniref:glycosyltransferase family 2 protein n=1 Tax=Carnobacterium maltaromaticum TaxID=2751 RepID=UPI0039B0D2E2